MYLKKEHLILFHVPKCGGVTVYRTLGRYFDRYVTLHDPQDGPMAPMRAPFIATHTTFTLFRYDPREDWTVTLLREPQQRLRSQYRFWAGVKPSAPQNSLADSETRYVMNLARELSFIEFLEVKEGPLIVHLDNVMVRHFADFARVEEKVGEKHFKMACANLEKIDDIMITETLGQDLLNLVARLGRAPAYQMQKGNVTDELYVHHPDQHTFVSADITADSAYRKAVEPLIAYDTRLYAFAKALKDRRAADRNRTYHRFLDLPSMTVFEAATNVTYALADSPASRAILWGEWSSRDDTRA
jgi:Sulfotransferase family